MCWPNLSRTHVVDHVCVDLLLYFVHSTPDVTSTAQHSTMSCQMFIDVEVIM